MEVASTSVGRKGMRRLARCGWRRSRPETRRVGLLVRNGVAGVLRCGLPHFRMVEEPHRVLAIVSRRCRKGIEQLALPLDSRCLAILRDHLLKECAPGLQAQSAFHVCLPWQYPVRGTIANTPENFLVASPGIRPLKRIIGASGLFGERKSAKWWAD